MRKMGPYNRSIMDLGSKSLRTQISVHSIAGATDISRKHVLLLVKKLGKVGILVKYILL